MFATFLLFTTICCVAISDQNSNKTNIENQHQNPFDNKTTFKIVKNCHLQKNQARLAASLDSVMNSPMALGVTFLLLGLIQMWPPSYFL